MDPKLGDVGGLCAFGGGDVDVAPAGASGSDGCGGMMTDCASGLLGDLRAGDVAMGFRLDVDERDRGEGRRGDGPRPGFDVGVVERGFGEREEVDEVNDRLMSPAESRESSALERKR